MPQHTPMSDATYPRVEYLDPAQLQDNPLNWKFHPAEQLDTIRESIDQLGHLKPLGTFNIRTRRLLDGHARKSLYAGQGVVPIWCVDLPEELEARAIATLDPSGWTSVADRSRFADLLKAIPPVDHAATAKLLELVKQSSTLLNGKAEETEQAADVQRVSLPLDTLWPSDNGLDIAALIPDMQADQIPGPVLQWGSQGQTKLHKGTWHFYAPDSKFEVLWKFPDRVFASQCQVLVEPNFSTLEQSPLWFALAQIGRKRWIARYWQAQGKRVLVDLNAAPKLNRPCPELGGAIPNLLGVPQGWTAYATRAHANQPEHLLSEWELAREHSGSEHPLFLCVGGGRRVKQLAQQHGWLAVDEPVEQALGNREDAA